MLGKKTTADACARLPGQSRCASLRTRAAPAPAVLIALPLSLSLRYIPFSLSAKAWTLRRFRGSSPRYLFVSRFSLRARATPSAASANPLRALDTPAAPAAHSKPCALRQRSTTRMHSLLLPSALPSLSSSSVPLATPRVCSTSTPHSALSYLRSLRYSTPTFHPFLVICAFLSARLLALDLCAPLSLAPAPRLTPVSPPCLYPGSLRRSRVSLALCYRSPFPIEHWVSGPRRV